MRLVIVYFLSLFFVALNALAENNQATSTEKKNIGVKSDKIKKMSGGVDYPGIQFQKYLQQNPILENEAANNGQQEISVHQNYPELKQYSIVIKDKKLEESKKSEEKNDQENNLDLDSKTPDEQIFFRQIFDEHNYNHPSHDQLWE